MKTILIIIGGMADIPDLSSGGKTPLGEASVPSLDIIGSKGKCGSFNTVPDNYPINVKNALFSLLGYDLSKGIPEDIDLMEFGMDANAFRDPASSLKYFVIPGFSGHGVILTTSTLVRGIGRCAFLNPVDIYVPGATDSEILDAIAKKCIQSIHDNEFVLIYVDNPLRYSITGDPLEKKRSLEIIDYHLITPIADFVWKSNMFINLAVTSDVVASWRDCKLIRGKVPAAVYFNDREVQSGVKFSETDCQTGDLEVKEPADLIRFLISSSPFNEDSDDPLPF